jgi:hypothetical protein
VIDYDALIVILFGLAGGIIGTVILVSPPAFFQRLNSAGLIVFTIFMIVFPPLSWVTWLIPKLKTPKESVGW